MRIRLTRPSSLAGSRFQGWPMSTATLSRSRCVGGRPLEGVQRSFSDGDAERWIARVEELREGSGVRIGAAIHSVRAVDPASMRTVAAWARRRKSPLHIHLAEQPAEVDECIAV